jgi:hypothetical protein
MIFLILSFFLGALFGFVSHILLTFASSQNEPDLFSKINNSENYEQ